MNAHVFPHQLRKGCGLRLAISGHAAAPLFPTVASWAARGLDRRHRGLTEADFFAAGIEDCYPDIFALLTDPETRRRTRNIVAEQLAHLPHRTVTLSLDVVADGAVLTEIVAGC